MDVVHLPSLGLPLVPAPDLVRVRPGLFRAPVPVPVPDRSRLLLLLLLLPGALALGVAVLLHLVVKG